MAQAFACANIKFIKAHTDLAQASACAQGPYAFDGQKRSPEISATAQTAEYWEYNGDVGRRWNMDPKPVESFSPYSCFGDNPIRFNDALGDTLRGVNATSGQRAFDAIQEVVTTIAPDNNNCQELMNFFQLNNDNETFKPINQTDFEKAANDLGLTNDQKGLLQGYVDAINDKNVHFVAILGSTEKFGLEGITNLTGNQKNLLEDWANKTQIQRKGMGDLNIMPNLGGTTYSDIVVINNSHGVWKNYIHTVDSKGNVSSQRSDYYLFLGASICWCPKPVRVRRAKA